MKRGEAIQGAERKIVQNAVFRGKRHDNKILNVQIILVDISDIFNFFVSARGGGRGSLRRSGGGEVDFLLKIPERGSPGGRGAERPGGCLRRIGEFGEGGGLNIFFRGRNVHQVNSCREILLFLRRLLQSVPASGGLVAGDESHDTCMFMRVLHFQALCALF